MKFTKPIYPAANSSRPCRNKVGYEEPPDLTRTKDSKGNTILCYSCGTASHGNRQIIQCDYCGENWHLDCLDPPLANPPARNLEGRKVHDWMCPLHADHELRRLDASLLNHRDAGRRRKVHIRKPRNAKVVETALRRGVRNNGIVEVVDDESEDSGSEFYEEESQDNKSVVLRLPVSGIKLDFIDKVKQYVNSELALDTSDLANSIAQNTRPAPANRARLPPRPSRSRSAQTTRTSQLRPPHLHGEANGAQPSTIRQRQQRPQSRQRSSGEPSGHVDRESHCPSFLCPSPAYADLL